MLDQDYFESFLQKKEEPAWFTEKRRRAFKQMQNYDLPSFKHGLNIVLKPKFNFLEQIHPSISEPTTFTIDNQQEATILQGKEALSNELKDFLNASWEDKEDENKLYHLHQAFMNSFLFITIPKNTNLNQPIEITADILHTAITGIFILGETNSNATLLFNFKGSDSYNADLIKVATEPGSKLNIITMQHLEKEVINIQNRKSLTGKDSEVNWIDVALGSLFTKSDVKSYLVENGATTNNTVLYLAADEQKMDIFTGSYHYAPNTYSNIITRGAINNSAKALSRGLVKIADNAPNSNGYEKQEALLLSKAAEADAIPNLEIGNHDVKCSHGSTIGQVDEEQLFYLMSRGMDEETAKYKIIEGFFVPLLDLFKDESIKQRVHESITRGLAK